jgi:hypothetical protein
MTNKIFKIDLAEMQGNLLSLALIASLFILGVAYIYLINTSIFLVNSRRVAEEKSAQIESELALLETNYMATQTTIDLPLALSKGFVEAPKDSTFAYRTKPAGQETGISMLR